MRNAKQRKRRSPNYEYLGSVVSLHLDEMLQSVLQRLVVVVLVEIRRVTVQTAFKKLGHKRHLWSRGDGGDTKRKSGQKYD